MITPKPAPFPVSFYMRKMKNEQRSRYEGRDVFEEQEWIRKRVSPESKPERQVTESDRQEYALEYEAWKLGRAAPGTPLSVLVAEASELELGEDFIDEMKATYGITTIEHLIGIPDGQRRFPNAATIARRGREVLQARKERGEAEQAESRAFEVNALQKQNEELRARLAAIETRLTQALSLEIKPHAGAVATAEALNKTLLEGESNGTV